MRTGVPLVLHASNGLFELVGISSSSGLCFQESQRATLNDPPSIWIDIYPYNDWIFNVITAHVMPLLYPNNVKLSQSADGRYKTLRGIWVYLVIWCPAGSHVVMGMSNLTFSRRFVKVSTRAVCGQDTLTRRSTPCAFNTTIILRCCWDYYAFAAHQAYSRWCVQTISVQ